jgi:antagonist of KipI
MAIRILKQGLLDTIQDAGRYGYQHLGINPGGVMDMTAMRVANMVVGNTANEPVIEMHFPAAEILFEDSMLIALAGADFGAMIDEQEVAVHQPVFAEKGSVLKCTQNRSGARLYLAVHGGWTADRWLGSASTHLKVQAGGHQGRALQKHDIIPAQRTGLFDRLTQTTLLHWQVNVSGLYTTGPLQFIPGAEYEYLDDASRQQLLSASFMISRKSDRMGYRLQGASLHCDLAREMISSAVTTGTIQLLPDGQLIILMADHQTTGGYPRIGHLLSTCIPSLSQCVPGQEISFIPSDLETAEKKMLELERNLQQLQNACTFRLQEYVK